MISALILIAGLSVILFVVSIIAIPFMVAKIPVDYFDERRVDWSSEPTWKSKILWVLKNLVGLILLLAGIIMLVTPGQGFFSIVLGIVLLDFPNKRYWERRIISNPKVLSGLNWLRDKRGVAALRL